MPTPDDLRSFANLVYADNVTREISAKDSRDMMGYVADVIDSSEAATLNNRNLAESAADGALASEISASDSASLASTKASEAAASASSILDLTVSATSLPFASPPTADYDPITGAMTLGIPSGEAYVVNNITQLNLLTPTLGAQALVVDATGDPAVTKFSAVYSWLFAISKWVLTLQIDFDAAILFALGAKGVFFDPSALASLTQDSAGTIPITAAGQPVGRSLDKSGNEANATQVTSSKRPIYSVIPKGGRRNLLTYSEDFANAIWTKQPGVITTGGQLAPDGSATATRVDLGVADRLIGQTIAQPAGNYTTSFSIKGTLGETIRYKPGGTPEVTLTLTGAWQTITVTTTTALTQFNISSYGGATARTVYLWRPQIEAGVVATPYQRVVSAYEVTEPGIQSLPHLASDLIDDELPATVVNLGTNATVWFAVDGVSTILTGQTVAAGPIVTLRGARTYTMGAIDRPLSVGETAALTVYLNKARGAL